MKLTIIKLITCLRCGYKSADENSFVAIGAGILCRRCEMEFQKEYMPRWKRNIDTYLQQFHELLDEFIKGKKEKVLLT